MRIEQGIDMEKVKSLTSAILEYCEKQGTNVPEMKMLPNVLQNQINSSIKKMQSDQKFVVLSHQED